VVVVGPWWVGGGCRFSVGALVGSGWWSDVWRASVLGVWLVVWDLVFSSVVREPRVWFSLSRAVVCGLLWSWVVVPLRVVR